MNFDALKSELRESAITMANLPTEFGVACLTEAGAQRIAKVLTDAATALEAMEAMEPVACLVNADAGAMVWPISDINEAETYCDEGEFPELLYPAATVSALQARIAELEQDAARGQVKCHKGAVVREFENEIGNRIKITIEGPTSTSENILTPMEATELRRALIAAAPKETP